MLANGESRKGVIQPVFNRAIMIDFQGAKITSDDNIWSPRDWYARNLGKIDFPPKFVLFFPLREEVASRRGPFGRFYSGKEAPKTNLGQG